MLRIQQLVTSWTWRPPIFNRDSCYINNGDQYSWSASLYARRKVATFSTLVISGNVTRPGGLCDTTQSGRSSSILIEVYISLIAHPSQGHRSSKHPTTT